MKYWYIADTNTLYPLKMDETHLDFIYANLKKFKIVNKKFAQNEIYKCLSTGISLDVYSNFCVIKFDVSLKNELLELVLSNKEMFNKKIELYEWYDFYKNFRYYQLCNAQELISYLS